MLLAGHGFAQSQARHDKRGATSAKAQPAQNAAQSSPIVVNIVPAQKTDEERAQDQKDRDARALHEAKLADYEQRLADATGELAGYTEKLAWLTGALVFLGLVQLGVFAFQSWQLKRTVDVAVAESQPVLNPIIVDTSDLHSTTADASITFAFENYGKTPGVVRLVRSALILGDQSDLPSEIDFESLPQPQDHEQMVPGETRGEAAKYLPGASVPASLSRPLTIAEAEAVQATALSPGYKRFHLLGLVHYDDYFGNRHTQRFCIKLRQSKFQSPRGGQRFNRRTSERIPGRDPLD